MKKIILGVGLVAVLGFGTSFENPKCKEALEIHNKVLVEIPIIQQKYYDRVINKLFPNFLADWLAEREIKEALKDTEKAKLNVIYCDENYSPIVNQWNLYYIFANNIVEESRQFREELKEITNK